MPLKMLLLLSFFKDINVEQRLKIEHLLSHKASNWIKDKVSYNNYQQVGCLAKHRRPKITF